MNCGAAAARALEVCRGPGLILLSNDDTTLAINLIRSQKVEAFRPNGNLISDQHVYIHLLRNQAKELSLMTVSKQRHEKYFLQTKVENADNELEIDPTPSS